jgi:thymidylate synthase
MQQYHQHLKTILEHGVQKDPERGQEYGTISLFGYQNRYDLSKGFPILTTKYVNFRNIVVELLWFLKGDTNIKYLVDNGVNIWNEDAYNYFCKLFPDIAPYKTLDQFLADVREAVIFHPKGKGRYTFGDCGYQYGKVWRDWTNGYGEYVPSEGAVLYEERSLDQIKRIIQRLKTSPTSRRNIVTAIDPAHDEELALYWCHAFFQFNCRKITNLWDRIILNPKDEKLFDNEVISHEEGHKILDEKGVPKYYIDIQLYQRSADMFLGVPYNISSYCLLVHIIAKVCNMIPGEFIHTFGDSHIYLNHTRQVEEILQRDCSKHRLPTLKSRLSNSVFCNADFNILIKDLVPEDFELEGYESYPAIKAELVSGLTKQQKDGN